MAIIWGTIKYLHDEEFQWAEYEFHFASEMTEQPNMFCLTTHQPDDVEHGLLLTVDTHHRLHIAEITSEDFRHTSSEGIFLTWKELWWEYEDWLCCS